MGSFLITANTLVALGDLYTILDTRLYSIGWISRSVSHISGSLKRFQQVDLFRIDHLYEPAWTWINVTGLNLSYLDRIIFRP